MINVRTHTNRSADFTHQTSIRGIYKFRSPEPVWGWWWRENPCQLSNCSRRDHGHSLY